MCGVSSKAPIALASIQPTLANVWVTPLGNPVLPEVKKMKAGSSGAGDGKSKLAGCWSHRASKLELRSFVAPYLIMPRGSFPASAQAARSSSRSAWAK